MMEKEAEIFITNISERNIEEWVTLDIRGLPHSIFQMRILGAEAGG
jgi:hypothetical protein